MDNEYQSREDCWNEIPAGDSLWDQWVFDDRLIEGRVYTEGNLGLAAGWTRMTDQSLGGEVCRASWDKKNPEYQCSLKRVGENLNPWPRDV